MNLASVSSSSEMERFRVMNEFMSSALKQVWKLSTWRAAWSSWRPSCVEDHPFGSCKLPLDQRWRSRGSCMKTRCRLVWLLGLACALETKDCADCVQPECERYAPMWTLNLETHEYKVLRFEINNFNAATCVHTSCDLRGEFVWGKFYIHFHLRWMTEAP